MKKAAVMDFASKLPEETSIDEIIERLIIVEKIEKGRQQVKDQKVNSEDQAKEKLNIWLSQFGRTRQSTTFKTSETTSLRTCKNIISFWSA